MPTVRELDPAEAALEFEALRALRQGVDEELFPARVVPQRDEGYRLVASFDYLNHGLRITSHHFRGADEVTVYAGGMFWFRQKKFSGSYFLFSATRRSYVSPR